MGNFYLPGRKLLISDNDLINKLVIWKNRLVQIVSVQDDEVIIKNQETNNLINAIARIEEMEEAIIINPKCINISNIKNV